MDKSRPFVQVNPQTGSLPARPGTEDSTPTLPHVGIFAGLSAQSLRNLAGYGKFEAVSAGTEIVREGTIQDRLHVIVRGRLALTARRGGRDVPVSEACAGECLGEASLLEPSKAAATLRAVEDAVLWSLDSTGLRVFMSDHPGGSGAFLMGVAGCLSARLREANLRIARHHMLPVETLPAGRERAITAGHTPIQPSCYERIKQTVAMPLPRKKVRISTKIKM